MPDITVQYADVPRIKWKVSNWKKWLRSVAEAEGFKIVNLEYVFCSDEYLLGINRKHLHHDDYTDIITFDLSEEPIEDESSKSIDGLIYISLVRVTENAEKYHVSLFHELARVMVHGVLHLCGYGDKTPEEQLLMRAKEDEYLSEFDQL
jgi:rRNA maturation RNase YbeY